MVEPTTHWFVAPNILAGDGSREKPFHDPWVALHSAGPGDTIHIAAGTYFGRYERSSWIVDSPNLTVLGGYSRDFTKRTPWQTPSVLAAYPDYEYVRENNLIAGRSDHSGLVLDGVYFDSAGRNTYGDKPAEELGHYPQMDGPIASFNCDRVTIRNCVFANSTAGGVELTGDGSRFENNLVINIIGTGMLDLRSASGGRTQLLTVINNSFCFAHDTAGPPFGQGADQAVCIRVNCPAVIQNNVFLGCGNAGVSIFREVERITLDGNLFYLSGHDAVTTRLGGASASDVEEKNIEEMEDLGFKSCAGNVVQDPGVKGLRTDWFDLYGRQFLALYAKPPREAVNAMRTAAGLPALAAADTADQKNQGALAPRLWPADALAISLASKQGCHPVELAVQIAPSPAPSTPTYRPIDWSAINQPDPSLANQRVELRAGIGTAQNITLLSEFTPETHMGFRIYQPGTDDGSIFVLFRRFTLTDRRYEEAIKSNNGREVENTYYLRGVYRTDLAESARQKVTLLVESIAPAPSVSKESAPRPQGRDWFVKAGSTGGDGTREKPFRDPFQALEKAEGGDAIHVAGGDYFGKLRSGQWKILIRNLTLLGGYNADFMERNPWKNPTRFLLNEEEKAKGNRNGKILESQENSDGLILDGFIFDGASYNNYLPTGSLDLATSPTDTLVSLRGGQSAITVRNCVFLNTPAEAVNISCPYGVFENNLVLNASGWCLRVNAGGAGPWTVRHNTFLFAADPTPRAGTGKSSPDGTAFLLSGRASTVVDANIFAFADNYGVRCGVAQESVSFINNVFAANLFNHLTDEQYLWADRVNWDRRVRSDSGYAAVTGNTLELPKLPVDPGFADKALARLFALPSRISDDEWKTIASQIGSSAKPPVAPSAASAAATPPATPAATPAAKPAVPSLNDLIASLGSMKSSPAKPATPAASTGAAEPAAPIYCPLFDWKKALALFQEGEGPGARRRPITVPSFSAAAVHAQVPYTPITGREIDANLASLDNKAVELDLTEARESSTNPFLYPSGTNRNDYTAYSVTVIGDSIRTRVSIVVRQDTAVSKALSRTNLNDTFHVRGIARVLSDNAMSIVVDAAELAQEARR